MKQWFHLNVFLCFLRWIAFWRYFRKQRLSPSTLYSSSDSSGLMVTQSESDHFRCGRISVDFLGQKMTKSACSVKVTLKVNQVRNFPFSSSFGRVKRQVLVRKEWAADNWKLPETCWEDDWKLRLLSPRCGQQILLSEGEERAREKQHEFVSVGIKEIVAN